MGGTPQESYTTPTPANVEAPLTATSMVGVTAPM